MSEIMIRDADQSMIPRIREQRVKAYSEYAEVLPDKHWRALKGTLSSNIDTEPGVDLIVAESEGEILGSVILFPAKKAAYGKWLHALDYPELRMLAVSPEARGKGVASKLVQECIDRTKRQGYSSLGLHTGEFMKNAIKLYERFGFKRLPEFDFEPGNDGIIVKAFILDLNA